MGMECRQCIEKLVRNEKLDLKKKNLDLVRVKSHFTCVRVRSIDLSCNKLEKCISFPNIHEINLNNNCIKEIDDLLFMGDLRVLLADNNRIESIEMIGYLSKLRTLSLAFNPLRSICPSIIDCIHLQFLDLSHCFLDKVPCIESILSLQSLDLSYNRLTNLNLDQLHNLKTLKLQHNELDSIGTDLNSLDVEFVDLSENNLWQVPNFDFSKLKYLDISENNICILPEDLVRASTVVLLRGNPFIPKKIKEVKLFSLKEISARSILNSGMTHFQHIERQVCPICDKLFSEEFYNSVCQTKYKGYDVMKSIRVCSSQCKNKE